MTAKNRRPRDQCLPDGQRLDVWLFRTRLVKSRSLATKMILKGKVRVTQHGRTQRVTKPNTCLRPGDKAVFVRGEALIHVEMLGIAARRGPASEAQTLYRIHPMDVSEGASNQSKPTAASNPRS